ncbi:hypothetical protein INS49_009387 [Diaporthe citri]|uniref:uncharacterized protein n=1 Tax=Diaporthe citri TaxID=83186 RepID=UPI001C7F8F8D|nr:uncharacterized protein INS49_009387 [Diaporthe citri]KAG6361163.1 hypothetical protein INS49_009387 [Diaporthe citri]
MDRKKIGKTGPEATPTSKPISSNRGSMAFTAPLGPGGYFVNRNNYTTIAHNMTPTGQNRHQRHPHSTPIASHVYVNQAIPSAHASAMEKQTQLVQPAQPAAPSMDETIALVKDLLKEDEINFDDHIQGFEDLARFAEAEKRVNLEPTPELARDFPADKAQRVALARGFFDSLVYRKMQDQRVGSKMAFNRIKSRKLITFKIVAWKLLEKTLAAQRGELLLDPKFKIERHSTFLARYRAVDDALQKDDFLVADALFSDEWRDRIAAAPETELARKQGNKKSNEEKNAKLAHATRLKQVNPNFDFKTADPIDAKTSSRRSSKRAKRYHDEFVDEEQEDSQLQTAADQVNDQPQADDATLVNNDNPLVNETPQALDDQGHDQNQQPSGAGQIDDQAQPPVVQTNNHDQHIVYQDGHQAQDAMDPANIGDQQIEQQHQYQHQQEHTVGQVYDHGQLPPQQANYQAQPGRPAMMQQANSFNNQDFENMEPLSQDAFQQVMNRPSTMNDVFFGRLSPEIPYNFWQPPTYPRSANEMGNGGRSAATSRTVSPGPDTSPNYVSGQALQPGSEFDGQPGSGSAFGQGP